MNQTAHNHPPLCCCPIPPGDMPLSEANPEYLCPLCSEHGELAQLAEPQPGECPLCHSLIGREHTEYCRFTGIVSDLPQLESLIAVARIRGEIHTQTSQPATQTGQPTTHARFRTPGYDGPEGTEWPRPRKLCHHTHPSDCDRSCGYEPTPHQCATTPGECTYPGCTAPRPRHPNQ